MSPSICSLDMSFVCLNMIKLCPVLGLLCPALSPCGFVPFLSFVISVEREGRKECMHSFTHAYLDILHVLFFYKVGLYCTSVFDLYKMCSSYLTSLAYLADSCRNVKIMKITGEDFIF